MHNAVTHIPYNIGVMGDENHTQAPIFFDPIQQV